MYLGRPHGISMDDVTVPRPSAYTNPDLQEAAAWADMMEMVGDICEALSVTSAVWNAQADLTGTVIT